MSLYLALDASGASIYSRADQDLMREARRAHLRIRNAKAGVTGAADIADATVRIDRQQDCVALAVGDIKFLDTPDPAQQ